MKQAISNIERRLPTLAVGIAALLLMSGCRHLQSSCFQKLSNPRVCPVCVAATPDACTCFPTDFGAGYSETRWSKLVVSEPLGGRIILDGAEWPAPQVTQAGAKPGADAREVAEPGTAAAEASELELVRLAELAELAELVQLSESVDPAALADYCADPRNPATRLPDISGAFSIPPVVVAPLPGAARD